jgi:hypothetical protein
VHRVVPPPGTRALTSDAHDRSSRPLAVTTRPVKVRMRTPAAPHARDGRLLEGWWLGSLMGSSVLTGLHLDPLSVAQTFLALDCRIVRTPLCLVSCNLERAYKEGFVCLSVGKHGSHPS